MPTCRFQRLLLAFSLAILGSLSWSCSGLPREAADAGRVAGPSRGPLVELDHVFVVVPDRDVAVAVLENAGITVDPELVTRHEGNGTSSVAAMFDSSYLELVTVDPEVSVVDGAEASVQAFREASTWRADAPPPFGIGLRRIVPGDEPLPYRGTAKSVGDWLEEGETFFVFESDYDHPVAFVVPDSICFPAFASRMREGAPQLFVHELGVKDITGIRLHVEHPQASVEEVGLPDFEYADASNAPLMELVFDGGEAEVTQDLRPGLPLLIRR